MIESASFLLALAAGFVVIVSPCVLPILPILIASMVKGNRFYPLYFTIGIVITFTILGTAFSSLARAFGLSRTLLNDIAIWVLIVMGIVMTVPVLERLVTKLFSPLEKLGSSGPKDVKRPWDALLLGILTAFVWIPCTGPVLGSILTLAASQENVFRAGLLLFTYAVGAGIPILAISYGGNRVTARLQFFKTHPEATKRSFGIVLILAALALKFGWLRYAEVIILPIFLPLQKYIGL